MEDVCYQYDMQKVPWLNITKDKINNSKYTKDQAVTVKQKN